MGAVMVDVVLRRVVVGVFELAILGRTSLDNLEFLMPYVQYESTHHQS